MKLLVVSSCPILPPYYKPEDIPLRFFISILLIMMAFTSSPAHSPSLSSSQVHVATRDMSRHDQEPMTNNTSTTTRTPASPPSSSSVYCSTTTLADRRKTKTSQYLVSDDFKSDFATKLSRFRTQCDSHFVPPRTHIPLTNYHHQDFSTIHELDETVLSGTDRNTTDIHQHSNPVRPLLSRSIGLDPILTHENHS